MFKRAVLLFTVGLVVLGLIPSAAAGPPARPFKGSVVGEATFPLDSDCPITGRRTHSEARGPATLLGLASVTSDHCTPAGDQIAGQMSFVAANGDELQATYTGTVYPWAPVLNAVITVDMDVIIVGGTGRFEGASGEADMVASITFAGFGGPAWPLRYVWAGTLIY